MKNLIKKSCCFFAFSSGILIPSAFCMDRSIIIAHQSKQLEKKTLQSITHIPWEPECKRIITQSQQQELNSLTLPFQMIASTLQSPLSDRQLTTIYDVSLSTISQLPLTIILSFDEEQINEIIHKRSDDLKNQYRKELDKYEPKNIYICEIGDLDISNEDLKGLQKKYLQDFTIVLKHLIKDQIQRGIQWYNFATAIGYINNFDCQHPLAKEALFIDQNLPIDCQEHEECDTPIHSHKYKY